MLELEKCWIIAFKFRTLFSPLSKGRQSRSFSQRRERKSQKRSSLIWKELISRRVGTFQFKSQIFPIEKEAKSLFHLFRRRPSSLPRPRPLGPFSSSEMSALEQWLRFGAKTFFKFSITTIRFRRNLLICLRKYVHGLKCGANGF